MTKTTIFVTESEENDKMIVATQKRMLRHNNEQGRHLCHDKGSYVMIIKAAESENSFTAKKFYVVIKNRREER